MSEYVIDIGVEVEDGYINNDVEWTAKIVNAAHKYKTVVIKIYEPVAIEQLNYKNTYNYKKPNKVLLSFICRPSVGACLPHRRQT